MYQLFHLERLQVTLKLHAIIIGPYSRCFKHLSTQLSLLLKVYSHLTKWVLSDSFQLFYLITLQMISMWPQISFHIFHPHTNFSSMIPLFGVSQLGMTTGKPIWWMRKREANFCIALTFSPDWDG